MITQHDIFNCFRGGMRPDFSAFSVMYIAPIKDLSGDYANENDIEMLDLEDAVDADFWTIYGVNAVGESQAIVDVSDQEAATIIALGFHSLHDLPVMLRGDFNGLSEVLAQ